MQDDKKNKIFFFSRKSMLIMLAGFVLTLIGFFLMSGGASEDPNAFNGDEIFSHRRITFAPFLVIAGYVIVIVGIMRKTK